MNRRSRIWLVVAALFSVGNLAGAIAAAANGEMLHSGVHVALLLLGAYFVWRLAPGSAARGIWYPEGAMVPDPSRELTNRLTNLEQSVEAVAIEVERIGEGQRFMTRLFTENSTPQAPREADAEPTDTRPREPAPDRRRD